jgi:hypothetical protein
MTSLGYRDGVFRCAITERTVPYGQIILHTDNFVTVRVVAEMSNSHCGMLAYGIITCMLNLEHNRTHLKKTDADLASCFIILPLILLLLPFLIPSLSSISPIRENNWHRIILTVYQTHPLR